MYVLTEGLSRRIYSLSDIRVLVLSLVIFMGMIVFVLPVQSSQLPGDSPDLSIIYTVEDLYNIAENYGDEGRAKYIQARVTFDVIWPIVYSAFLASGISWSFPHGSWSNSRWRYANILPVIALLFDYLENGATIAVMYRYPLRTPVIDIAATVFTPLKWFSLGLSFILLLIGLGKALWNRYRQ